MITYTTVVKERENGATVSRQGERGSEREQEERGREKWRNEEEEGNKQSEKYIYTHKTRRKLQEKEQGN